MARILLEEEIKTVYKMGYRLEIRQEAWRLCCLEEDFWHLTIMCLQRPIISL